MSKNKEVVVLSAFRPFLTYLSIYKLENFRDTDRRRDFWRAIALSALLAVYTFIFVLSEFVECYKFHFDLARIVQKLAFVVLGLPVPLIYLGLFWKVDKIIDVIDYLHGILVKRSILAAQIKANYEAIEIRYTRVTMTIVKIISSIVSSLYVLSAIFPISYALYDYPRPNQWTLPIDYATPYIDKWVNVYEQFLIDVIIEIMSCFVYYSFHMIAAFFHIGLCFYLNGMWMDLKLRLQEIQENMDKSGSVAGGKLKMSIANEIKFHGCLYEVANVIADVMSPILFLLLLSYAVTMAIFLIGLDLAEPLSVTFFGLILAIIDILTQMVIYCAFSETVTNKLHSTGDLFYEFPWYRMPVKLQKLIILVILRAQPEFRLTGLGIIQCSLGVFASIIRAASSYYLLIKSLS